MVKKGPNTVGKDIGFITALYSTDSVVVAPLPVNKNISNQNNNPTSNQQFNASNSCTIQSSKSRLPNREELNAMFINKDLLGMSGGVYWSSSVVTSGEEGTDWGQNFDYGSCVPYERKVWNAIRCIKR